MRWCCGIVSVRPAGGDALRWSAKGRGPARSMGDRRSTPGGGLNDDEECMTQTPTPGRPASCITSRSNLHTPRIPRHRIVLRIRSSSLCARQREWCLSGVRVTFTRREEDAHAPIGPNSPASKGRESLLARDLCNVRVDCTLSAFGRCMVHVVKRLSFPITSWRFLVVVPRDKSMRILTSAPIRMTQ